MVDFDFFFFLLFCLSFGSALIEGEEMANADSFERMNSDSSALRSDRCVGSYRFSKRLDILQYKRDRWLGV